MRPMFDMLSAAARRASLHMPGHQGSAPFGATDLYALDTTELDCTDNLYAASGAIAEAEALYAASAGAGASLLMTNGSTAGVQTMLMLFARPGDAVLLPRNAHVSAINGCVLGGLTPIWIPVRLREDGSVRVDEGDVLDAIRRHPQARLLLLSRPDYYGVCMPLERVIEAAHAAGMAVAVDEAHGAHFPWMDGLSSAGRCGADAWTQSAHKTLPALTGSAVLHLKDADLLARARTVLRRGQSSSPSFLLLLSLDDARAWMDQHGTDALRRVTEAADRFRQNLRATPYRDAHALWAAQGELLDPTRLVLDAPQGGFALAEALSAHGLDAEMADERRVVLILTAMTPEKRLDALLALLKTLPAEPKAFAPTALPGLPNAVMEPRRAAMGQTAWVALEQAVGRVAALPAGLYPPGIPLVCPGEEINRAVVACLSAAAPEKRFGLEGDALCVTTDV